MAPLGKAMYEAMEGPPDDGSKNALNNLERDAKYEENLSDTGRPSGLWLDMRQGAGTLADSEYDSPVIFTKIEDVKTVNDYQIAALAKWKVTGSNRVSRRRGRSIRRPGKIPRPGPGVEQPLAVYAFGCRLLRW